MAMRLGEILMEQGLLTEQQLEMALTSQLLCGGHLGTSLIELGFLDEGTLGTILSKASGVPYARPELFENIAMPTINTVSRKVAKAYEVVPLKLTDNAVHLALVDPKNLQSLDELSFAIGRRVIPWIAPEVRIFQALERYYGLKRRARYVALDSRLNKTVRPSPRRPAEVSYDLGDAEPVSMDEALSNGYFSEEGQDASYGFGRPWREIAEELESRESAALAMKSSRPAGSLMSIPELAERYCQAGSRDDLAWAALDFGAGRAERMLLMFVRGNCASVWQERGFSLPDGTRRNATFEVTSEALFRLPMGNDHYHGALPPSDECRSFYRTLGVDAPAELLLAPIHVNDHLVAAALADGGTQGRIHGEADEFVKAFRLFSTAVLMVALRKQLRDNACPVTRAGVPSGDSR